MRDDREGRAFTSGATRAADAVDIIFRVPRQIEIEDVADFGNVQTTGGNVACRQQRDFAGTKLIQCLGAATLIHIAMECAGVEAVLDERLVQHSDIAFAIAEDDAVLDGFAFAADEIAEKIAFGPVLGGRAEAVALRDRFCSGGLLGDFDADGIL